VGKVTIVVVAAIAVITVAKKIVADSGQ